MAKIRYSEEETKLALDLYFKESDLDLAVVRSTWLAHYIVISIGRVYLRHWSAMDAAGVTHVEGPEGLDGPPSFVDGYDMIRKTFSLSLKWKQRAQWYQRNHSEAVRHVVDWLDAAVHEDAAWLSNVDEKARPKKLMKCTTIEGLEREADKAMVKALQSSGKRKSLPESDERVVVTLGELTLVRLLTPAALDAESAAMKHCIGLGSYDKKLDLPGLEYYSVRDPENRPLSTLEIIDGIIIQFSGPRNSFSRSEPYDFVGAIRGSLGWITRAERGAYRAYVHTPHELSEDDRVRIAAVVQRGIRTAEERQRIIEERELRVAESGYDVADDRLDNIFARPPRP